MDFRDFKKEFVKTGFFIEEHSFERILTNGLPRKYIRNSAIFEKFLNAIEDTLEKCGTGKSKLKYSKPELVSKKYEQLKKQESPEEQESPEQGCPEPKCPKVRCSFQNRLWQLATFAMRADPELNAKDEEAQRLYMQIQAAKSFFDAWENEALEEISDETGSYYKVHKSVCFSLYTVLKQDPQIMKRLQQKFEGADKYFLF